MPLLVWIHAYLAPEVRRGDVLFDHLLGKDVIVGGYTEALTPWPRRLKTGKASLILTGTLVHAVQIESEMTVAHWWGVSISTVSAWRKALGVGHMTAGTRERYLNMMPGKLPPEAAARGRAIAATPEAIARMRETKSGLPVHPTTRAALLKAASRPKSAEWRAALSERNRVRPRPESWVEREWSPQEDAVLGSMPDRAAAAALGRTINAVRSRRKMLRCPAFTGGAARGHGE